MMMPPALRKASLTVHIAASAGWLGAVVAFLAVASTASAGHGTAAGAFAAMEAIARFALVPLSIAALVSGVVQALGTVWGLVRHYWVIAKLMITVLATAVLLAYLPTLSQLRRMAEDPAVTEVSAASPVLHAVAALAVLLVALVLSVVKPKGLTGFGAGRGSS